MDNMANFLLYGLFDPRNHELRYIGITTKSLKKRLDGHIRDKGKSYRSNWLRSLQKIGLRPYVQLIQKLYNWDDLIKAEIYWIKYFKDNGCNLTNSTDGGEGTLGWTPSDDWIEKRRKFMLGKRYSLGIHPNEETLKKLSKGHMGKTTGKHSRERIIKNSRSQGGRPIIDDVGNKFEIAKDAAKYYNTRASAITAVARGKRNEHRGHTFKFVDP